MPSASIEVARAVEERVRRLEGVAGLDPASHLATTDGPDRVRGVWVRTETPDGSTVSLEMDLVGLNGAALPDLGEPVRDAAARVALDHGVAVRRADARFTDIAVGVLPLQSRPAAGVVADRPDATAARLPDAASRTMPRTTLRVPLARGTRTVMVITVEVVEEGT